MQIQLVAYSNFGEFLKNKVTYLYPAQSQSTSVQRFEREEISDSPTETVTASILHCVHYYAVNISAAQ